MRIVSLLPSATETLFALGFHDEIVGVSHECDFPPDALTKTRVVSSRIPKDIPPAEVDRIVREHVQRGESIYAVDKDLMEELKPDLVVTQASAHAGPTGGDEAKVVRWLQAAAMIARVDPVARGYLKDDRLGPVVP